MVRKILLLVLVVLFLAGCGEKEADVASPEPQTQATLPTSTTPVEPEVPIDPVAELMALEITPSGHDKCFLSPCDCVCYMVQNVPKDAKEATCAIDCESIYDITGCDFTNFQCVTLD